MKNLDQYIEILKAAEKAGGVNEYTWKLINYVMRGHLR